MAAPPNWQSFSIQLPGQDLLEGARNILETLMVFLEVLKAILETVKAFLIDFGNPIKALVEALIQRIIQLFEALKRTGIYGWFDVPDPTKDPNFNRFVGGFPAFTTRFYAGLYDSKDPNRPQPIPVVTKGGFVIIVADAEGPIGLVRLIKVLLDFLGKEFLAPQYLAPANFKVLPLGDDGDPVLSVVQLFQDQPKSVVVEWALPPSTVPGDPGFSDLFGAIATQFIPPRFLIEKSDRNPAVGEVDISELGDSDATGQVTAVVQTKFESRGKPGDTIERKVRLTDQYYDPFFKFQKYINIDATTNTATFLLGQLGTYRYIDDDVELDKTYYYRVRAYSGSLDISGTDINWRQPEVNVIDQTQFIGWPGTDPEDAPVMGKATPVSAIRIPRYPADFDVIENLNRLFQTAFSLNFHLPLPVSAEVVKDDPALFQQYTDEHPEIIGRESLTSLAGPLTSFEAIPLIGAAFEGAGATDVTSIFQPSPVTGLLPELPWNNSLVQRNAARLANIVASAMLEANNAVAFKSLMEGPFPEGDPGVEGTSNISELVFEITKVQDPTLAGSGGVQDAAILYEEVFDDATVRRNVLNAVRWCKAFTLGGTPPDWIQVSLLRDIVPWSGQLLYNLLAAMQALLDAYQGVIDELKAFIDLLIRKIDTLEAFLAYLISLLDFILSLSIGFYILSVPEVEGDVNDWVDLVENAGGTPPPSGPGGYTGGVALAYVAIDIGPFAEAFKLIF
jgi:hypothetical protein